MPEPVYLNYLQLTRILVGPCSTQGLPRVFIKPLTEGRPDRNANLRNAIVFELEVNESSNPVPAGQPETDNPNEHTLRLWSRPLGEVRELAERKAPSTASEKTRRIILRQRSEAVRIYVLRRADGTCESCQQAAPFLTQAGRRPYLEPHHIYRLADGGPDTPDCVAAICPNCHKEIHHGINGKTLNDRLVLHIRNMEEQE